MNAWVPKDRLLSPSLNVGASATNFIISKDFSVTAGGARYLVVAVKCSSVTVGSGITIKLQTAVNTESSYEDAASVAVTTNDTVYIKFSTNVADDLLLGVGRIVVTTLAGASLTFDSLHIIQEL